jgi:hypothetical protein
LSLLFPRPTLRVFVLEGVEAVRADRDDLANAATSEKLQVLLGEGFEEIFVPEPPGGVVAASKLPMKRPPSHWPRKEKRVVSGCSEMADISK